MDLLSLDIKNFFTIHSDGIHIPLNVEDLVLISGINKDWSGADSNGAGKSLIFEAICWVFWGETVRGYKGDEVVNDRIKKDCRVVLTLKDGADTYRVVRYQKSTESEKPNDLLLLKNGEMKGTAHGKVATQQKINTLVGVDFDTFCAMMPGTKQVPANMTDSSIKELLEKILHTGDLPKALSITRTDLAEQRIQLNVLVTREDTLTTELEESRARVRDYNQRHKNFRALADEQIAVHMEKLSTYRVATAGAEEKIVDLKSKMNTEANKAAEDAADEEWMCSGPPLSRLNVALENYRRTNAASIATAAAKSARAEEDLDKAKQFEGICHECLQELTDGHVKLLLDQAQKECDLLHAEENKTIREGSAKVRTLMDDIVKAKALREKLNSKVEYISLKCADDRAFQAQVEEQEEYITTWVKDATTLDAEIKRLEESESGFEDLKSKELGILRVKRAEFKQVVADQAQYAVTIERLEFWEKAFAPTGIRSYVLDQVTPILNERAKYYCNLLSSGEMNIEFTTKTKQKKKTVDKFQIKTSFKHGASSWKGTSEGEKARANLVIALALGDLAAYRSHKKLKFRFLDEVFSHIDETGSDIIIKLLKDQQKQYGTVFVVTHSPRIQSQFKKKIIVTKEDGFSTVELDIQ